MATPYRSIDAAVGGVQTFAGGGGGSGAAAREIKPPSPGSVEYLAPRQNYGSIAAMDKRNRFLVSARAGDSRAQA